MKYYNVKILAKGGVFREQPPVDPSTGTTAGSNINKNETVVPPPQLLPRVKPKKNSTEKKYYSASEITEALSIALHQLRYLETKIPNLSNYKIRGRKYYTANDRNLFHDHLNINKKLPLTNPSDYINKIDKLITKFTDLSFQIKKILADTHITSL